MFSRFFTSHSDDTQLTQGGFGVIELMVSISIIVMVTSIILVRQTSFNSAILLRSQAYEVALQLREIQLAAVSASYEDSSAGFRTVLGAHFDATAGNNTFYRIFRDGDDDNFYDPSSEEYGRQGILDSRFEISDIRSIGDAYDGNGMSIVFERPNFDARFFDSGGEVTASNVQIDIQRVGTTEVRTIEITSAGQIAVQ